MQEGGGLEKLQPLPKLPANAKFVRHENKCFDLGAIGWMLDTKVVNPRFAASFCSFFAMQHECCWTVPAAGGRAEEYTDIVKGVLSGYPEHSVGDFCQTLT